MTCLQATLNYRETGHPGEGGGCAKALMRPLEAYRGSGLHQLARMEMDGAAVMRTADLTLQSSARSRNIGGKWMVVPKYECTWACSAVAHQPFPRREFEVG
eukprot:1156387-Pelagomonas_calceolata.AAC.7